MRRSIVLGLLLAFVLAPIAVQGQTDLIGDKDCFGITDPCPPEDGVTWLPGVWSQVTQEASDPGWQDIEIFDGRLASWTHTFAPGAYSAASLAFRTAGIADIAGPYEVFVDGVKVGELPFDGVGHVLVETFTFALDPLALADGMVAVSFQTEVGDSWAIDYSELTYTASVPEPATLLLLGTGLMGLAAVRIRPRF